MLLHTLPLLAPVYSSCFLETVSLASLSPGFLVPGIAAMEVDYVNVSCKTLLFLEHVLPIVSFLVRNLIQAWDLSEFMQR